MVAWFPEHLRRASNALCEIISISPESFPTVNTPLSNKKSIFRIWYPQTNTIAEDRKKILKILIKKYPDTLYGLLYSLVGSKNDTAFHIPRPKWRLFSELREIRVTPNYQEILKAGWEILDSFNLIPSLQEDGSLDTKVLKNG